MYTRFGNLINIVTKSKKLYTGILWYFAHTGYHLKIINTAQQWVTTIDPNYVATIPVAIGNNYSTAPCT